MAEHSSKTMEIVRAVQALYLGNTLWPTTDDLAKAVGLIVDAPAPAAPTERASVAPSTKKPASGADV